MSNSNFVVQNGLTAGSATIDAASGNINTDGSVTASNFVGDGSLLTGLASSYTLPTATDSVLGGIKIGSGLSIDGNGTISATGSYSNVEVAAWLATNNVTQIGSPGAQFSNISLGINNLNFTACSYVRISTTGAWQSDAAIILSASNGNVYVAQGNITTPGIKTDNYYYADGTSLITALSTATATANTALKGYVDGQVTTISNSITGANAAIVTANTAMQGYVDGRFTTLIGGSPAILDTLNEIAIALGNDSNLSVTLTNTITNANVAMKGYVDGQITTIAGDASVWPVPNTNGASGPSKIAIGLNAGEVVQGSLAVAIGDSTGSSHQGASAVALGTWAGGAYQGASAVAIGDNAASNTQGAYAVAIGFIAGQVEQGAHAIAIGSFAGQTSQAANTIILNATGSAVNGVSAQTSSFYVDPIRNATGVTQALFYNTTTKEITYDTAGTGGGTWPVTNTSGASGPTNIAIGLNTQSTTPGVSAVAIGEGAGLTSQGNYAVAIGAGAGDGTQGSGAVAIGVASATSAQGIEAVAIGSAAGEVSQGMHSIAIGYAAGNFSQAANTIILNATGSAVNGVSAQTGALYIDPIRNATGVANGLFYNPTTKEITYNTDASILNVAGNYQVNSFGVGTAGSATPGEIRATNNITAYYSDRRLKDVVGTIENALAAVNTLSGVRYRANELAGTFGYNTERLEVGVLAQEIQAVLPEVVVPAPFDIAQAEDGTEYSKSGENYLTVHYERIVPLLIEAIKELSAKVAALEAK